MAVEFLGIEMTEEQMELGRRKLDELNATRREARKTCTHAGYSFAKHGRCCPECGTFMVDFGD